MVSMGNVDGIAIRTTIAPRLGNSNISCKPTVTLWSIAHSFCRHNYAATSPCMCSNRFPTVVLPVVAPQMFRFVVSRDRRDRRDRHACGLLCTSLHPMFQLHFLLVGTVSGTWPRTGAAMVLGWVVLNVSRDHWPWWCESPLHRHERHGRASFDAGLHGVLQEDTAVDRASMGGVDTNVGGGGPFVHSWYLSPS